MWVFENVFRCWIFVSETEEVTDRMVSQLRHEGIRNHGNQIGGVSNEGCDMDVTWDVAITFSECTHEITPVVDCELYFSTYCDMFVVASCVLLNNIRQQALVFSCVFLMTLSATKLCNIGYRWLNGCGPLVVGTNKGQPTSLEKKLCNCYLTFWRWDYLFNFSTFCI